MIITRIKIALFVIVAATYCGTLSAQDLLARQAPVDRKLKSVDSLALTRIIKVEKDVFPALSLYPNWNNEHVNPYQDVTIPNNFEINLTGYYMPTTNTKITDVFGYRPRRRRMHYGLDIKVAIGDTIRAAFDGKVRIVKNQGRRKGYGKYIVIRHDNGLETVYGHLSKQLVSVDESVKAGEPIGLGGNTGRSTGSHLHFETRFLGVALNPAQLFNFEKQDVTADTYTFNKPTINAKAGNITTGEGLFYKVKSGDTLSRIAARQGVSIDRLCKLNRITRKTILRPGQILKCA